VLRPDRDDPRDLQAAVQRRPDHLAEGHQRPYEFDWATPDMVYIAEVYKVEERSETMRIFQTIDGEEERYSQKNLRTTRRSKKRSRLSARRGAPEARQAPQGPQIPDERRRRP
jgi:hypothetical protein